VFKEEFFLSFPEPLLYGRLDLFGLSRRCVGCRRRDPAPKILKEAILARLRYHRMVRALRPKVVGDIVDHENVGKVGICDSGLVRFEQALAKGVADEFDVVPFKTLDDGEIKQDGIRRRGVGHHAKRAELERMSVVVWPSVPMYAQ
jgi:hypothetical protein